MSSGTRISNLPTGESRSHAEEADRHPTAAEATERAESGVLATRMITRARWLMIASALTTLIALAAVIGVIGYRVFHAGGSGAAATAERTIMLPKGARVIATAVADERIVVTLDIGGATEIRIFDVKALKQTGRIRFATEP